METNEIKEVIQTYFDAGYESDGEKMRTAIHNAAHTYVHDERGALMDRDKETFIKLVESGKSNAPYPRQEEILSIDFTSENTAVALVKVRIGKILFTDVLSFIRLDGKWTIISKLAAGEPVE